MPGIARRSSRRSRPWRAGWGAAAGRRCARGGARGRADMYEAGGSGRGRLESLDGAVKAWAQLNRQGLRVARCAVERLMRVNGWRGNTRRRKARTTVPDPDNPRYPDLVGRNFRAQAPGRLLVADFTYVPLVTGGDFSVAFLIDPFARTIPGCEPPLTKQP